ncbi:MAG TPA: hypothetical protein VFI24_03730 [Pyrinomonadaceae bacterium]|nr:hypothetical protein [Pyrinomonadaceae bacterium]
MSLLVFDKHFLWSYLNAEGGTTSYYYSDAIAWLAGAIALLWLSWFLIRRFQRSRALRRPRRSTNRLLKRIVKIKRELSSRYLRPGFSNTIHAVGIGKIPGSNDYCIQVFVSDANQEWRIGAAGTSLPALYRGIAVIMIEMPLATFLHDAALATELADGIRGSQEILVGGISGANANLAGESGTIGYFCTRKSKLPRRKEIHLLSNSHVFADLSKTNVDEGDLIMQPSPGEPASNRPIASLVNFTALNFDDQKKPNHADAAIARLWSVQQHKPVIPLIGAVKGYVRTKDFAVGETARKFGRTTGYTQGCVFSIYLDIWVHYDRRGQSAFFQDQFLIEPAAPEFAKFVAKGDSGSLLVDDEQYAVGLLFAGMSEAPQSTPGLGPHVDPTTPKPQRIEGYGVANPISEVMDRLKIELVV